MASDKAIANGLITRYGGANRKEVLVLLRQASAAGRADDRRSVRAILANHRLILGQSLRAMSVEDRLGRLKVIRSIRTIDALQELL
jgi:hypothetical protein